MSEPTLVILAAGMGSRFGGLKQITPVDPYGHAIIDFSLFDAYRAGFRKVAFIIKHEIEEDFKAAVGRRMSKRPGISGQIFGALGQAGINIRWITQSPDELNIIFGVNNDDFASAIRVLYDSFAK